MLAETVNLDSEVEALLAAAQLPTSDLATSCSLNLLGVRENGRLVGVVGIEAYGEVGMLRSLAVAEARRGAGLGARLVTNAETWAGARGVKALFLLTTTAAGFFARLGYEAVERSQAPAAIGATAQFTALCPDSSAFLRKVLAAPLSPMHIAIDDLSRPAIHALLNEHLQSMYALSPPESVHALDLEKLRQPDITFWTAWEGPLLVGCGALKELEPKHGEIKSMRTPNTHRRRGVGRAVLTHIIEVARSRSYERLSLETGSMEAFKPAQRLYASFGFTDCGPFGDYSADPHSVFMTLRL